MSIWWYVGGGAGILAVIGAIVAWFKREKPSEKPPANDPAIIAGGGEVAVSKTLQQIAEEKAKAAAEKEAAAKAAAAEAARLRAEADALKKRNEELRKQQEAISGSHNGMTDEQINEEFLRREREHLAAEKLAREAEAAAEDIAK